MMKRIFSMMLLCAVVIFSSCSKDDDETISVTGVSLNKTALSLTVDGTETLIATITPNNATNKNVQWGSSDKNIVTVSADGVVTAKTQGKAVITVTTEDGNKTATCEVTVTNAVIAVTQVTLNKNELELSEGAEETLTATVIPTDATDKTVTWTSSKMEIATVDATGKVVAVKAGATTITATSGGQTATCEVTVKVPVASPYAWYTKDKTATSFEITTVVELKQFANLVNGTDKASSGETAAVDFTGKTIILKASTAFDLNNEEWTPIGTSSSYAFKGTFDGNNNSVTGLKVSSGSYRGLFGWVPNATLKNLKIDGGVVSGAAGSCAGGLVGRLINSTVENCSSSATVSGQQSGGIAGVAFQSNIKGCFASGNITAIDGSSDIVAAGGLVGYFSSGGSAQACYYMTGTVTGAKAPSGYNSCTGGVIGCSDSGVEVRNCYSTGSVVAGISVTSGNVYTGGVIGYASYGSKFSSLLYVSGKGATSGVGEKKTDDDNVKALASVDKLSENITWLNTNLPGEVGWSFNANGTLKKAN